MTTPISNVLGGLGGGRSNTALVKDPIRNRLTDLENELMVTSGEGLGEGRLRIGDCHVPTVIFKTDNQEGPTLQNKEHCSIFCNNLNGKRI